MQRLFKDQRWLLIFAPVALVLERWPGVSAPFVFFSAALAIVPVANLMGHGTEHVAAHTGDAIGGLLNVVLGNLPELIIGIVALKAGLFDMVTASLVGAILFNLLLVLGVSLLVGGLRWHVLSYNAQATQVYSAMMFVAVLSLALPSLYQQAFGSQTVVAGHDGMNLGLASILLVLFGLYLFFMIRTHPEVFASVGPVEEHRAEAPSSLTKALGTLALASIVAAVLSETLVGAATETGEALHLSTPFLGIVVLASVGGMAEGVSAVRMARRGRLDLSIAIALGSCILISLFVAPVLVFTSYLVATKPLHLAFSTSGVCLLFLAVLIAAVVVSGGSGHWYKGTQLIAVYLMIALLLYLLPL